MRSPTNHQEPAAKERSNRAVPPLRPSECAVVMGERWQVQEGVDEQQQQQSQHQGQAPVVGDQHLVAASLQEGTAPFLPRLLHR